MSDADAFGHLPFLSGGAVASGSFFATSDNEDRFMEYIWRVRKWRFSAASDVIWNDGSSPNVVIPSGFADFPAGSSAEAATSQFINEDDILCHWRGTQFITTIGPVNAGSPGELRLGWDATGNYSEDSTTLYTGILSSYVRAFVGTPDVQIYLYSDSTTGKTVNTGVNLVFDPDFSQFTIPLFDDPQTQIDFPGSSWSGGPLTLAPIEWWPWNQDGDDDPTWSTLTGQQLRDPRNAPVFLNQAEA
jgi:hypothetical protein